MTELGVTHLRSLHRVMSEVNASDNVDEVLQLVAAGVVEECDFGVAAIAYLRADGFLEVTAVAGSIEAHAELLGSLTSESDLEKEFALAEEWGLLRFLPADRPSFLKHVWIPKDAPLVVPDAWQPADMLLAPLRSPTGSLLGVLSVDLPRDGRRPNQDCRDLLEMYAVQAGTALANAEQRHRMREDLRLAAAVRRINEVAGRRLDLGHVIDASVGPIAAGLRCKVAWLRAFDGEGELPGRGRGAIHPPLADLTPPDSILSTAADLARACWDQGRRAAIITAATSGALIDERSATEILEFVAPAGVDALALIPYGQAEQCLGYMVLARKITDGAPWTEAELEAGEQIARDLGRAVANSALYERERDLAQKLTALDAYKSELIATICHELKTPLTSITGHLELCEDVLASATPRSHDAIGRNLERLNVLIADLLLLAKVGDPNRPLETQNVAVEDLVRTATEPLRVQASGRDITIVDPDPEGSASPDATFVRGNAAELERAFSNIISNAIKYSPDSGRVALDLTRDESTVSFVCTDNGLGISQADQAHLGTEFFRSTNTAAAARPGTGLGLSIVRRILERHVGALGVVSEPGSGSTFTVTLPRSRESAASIQT